MRILRRRVEEAVLAALRNYAAAMQTGDVEGQLAFFSEEFQHGSGMTKADLRTSFGEQKEPKRNEAKTLDLDNAKVVVEGDVATVDPVTTRSPTVSGFIQFKIKRERTAGGNAYPTADLVSAMRQRKTPAASRRES